MAGNFKISARKFGGALQIDLAGDFDGSSAFELIHILEEKGQGVSKAFIHTAGLKHIYPFGRDIFHKHLRALNDQEMDIVFSGEKASQLASRSY